MIEKKEPRNFILVTADYSGLGFCLDKRLCENESQVILAYKQKPEDVEDEKEEEFNIQGEGLVEKIELDEIFKDREDYRDWYWIFDGNHNTDIGETLIKEGFKVFGGSQFTYDLENDREFGIEFAASCDLHSPEQQEFSSVEDGIKFLEENEEEAYVYKPNNEDSAFTTVPMSEEPAKANKEIQRLIKALGFTDYILQKMVQGVEVNVETWYIKGRPVFTIANLEDKRLHNGDLGSACGCSFDITWQIDDYCPLAQKTVRKFDEKMMEMNYTGFMDANVIIGDYNDVYFLEYCFDNKTEIMTKNGWKFIKDVPIGTEVATINKETGELEYQKTTDLIVQDYDGEMVKLSAGSLDVLMTPNHHNWVKVPKHTSKNKKEYYYKEIEAKNLKGGMTFKRDVKWNGQESSIFIIPEYIEHHYLGKYKKYHDIIHPAKTVSMDDWLSFLGYYLSEGSLDNEYSINITQYKFCDKIEETLKKLPFKYQKEKNGFRICSKQLGSQLSKFGKCNNKFVPNYIKELSPRQIEIFLSAYILGDGSIHKRTKQRTISTTSKIMADDLSELILKCGNYSIISEIKNKGTEMSVRGGKKYTRNHNQFVISERKESGEFWLLNKHIKKENYNGKVYCVTTPNHTIYVRRNGKAIWSANCARLGYNAHPNLFTTLSEKPALEVLADLIDDTFDNRFKTGFGGSQTLLCDHSKMGLPIHIPDTLKNKFYLFDGYLDEEDEDCDRILIGGFGKEIGIICDHSFTPKDTMRGVMNNAEKITFSNKFYRTDCDSDLIKNSITQRFQALRAMKLL